MSDDTTEQTQKAGRGGLAVLAAKVFFILTGLLQQALLPRAIGLADYGALSRVFAVSNVFNNVLVASSTQGVSRTIAGAGQNEREALRATLRIHGAIAAASVVLLATSAPFVAHFQHAESVLAPLLVMTGVLGIYALYAPLVGYINGRRQFTRQASLDIVAATLRTTGLLAVGWLFVRGAGPVAAQLSTSPGVLGAATGAVIAAAGVFAIALRWTGTGKAFDRRPEGVPAARAYVALIVPVMIAQLFTNGLMQADIFLLGRFLSLSAPETGAPDPARIADEWVAVYRACQLFAFLPYQLLFSVTQVLFPMLARAKAEEGDARVAVLVSRGCRVGAIAAGMMVCVVLAIPESLVKFAYGAEVAARATSSLRVLALGQAAFAMLGLATTILVSLGRERTAMTLTAGALGLLVTACLLAAPRAAFGEGQLHATALAVACALAVALAAGVASVLRVAGAFVPWKTALRVGACVLAAFAVGRWLPVYSKLATPLVAATIVGLYVGTLVLTRELGREDLGLVLAIVRKKRPPAT